MTPALLLPLQLLAVGVLVVALRARTPPSGRSGLELAVIASALWLLPWLWTGLAGVLAGMPLLRGDLALGVLALLAVGLGVGLRRAPPLAGPTHGEGGARDRPGPWALATAIGVAAAFAVVAGLLVLGLPRGFEVHAYHLPVGVQAFRSESLALWDRTYMHAYPSNAGLFFGSLLLWLPESWVSAANLPFLALCAATVHGLARWVGGGRSGAWLAAAGVATVPIFAFSAAERGADVAGAAFIGLAALFALRRHGALLPWALLSGVSAGLAFGFKSLHLVPAALIGLFVLASPLLRRRPVSEAGIAALLYGVGFLLLAGPWLARNAMETGNPLYPVAVQPFFDWLGWPGAPDFVLAERGATEREWVESSLAWIWYPWQEGHYLDQNFKHSSGLGPFFAAALVPSILWAAVELALDAARRQGGDEGFRGRVFLLATGAVVLAAWWGLGDRQPRYFMSLIVLLAPFTARALAGLSSRAARGTLEALWGASVLAMAAVLVAQLGVEVGARLLQSRDLTRHRILMYPEAVDRLAPGSIVLNAATRTANYSLLGEGLRNRVVDIAEARRHLFDPEAERWHFEGGALEALGVTHVYLHAGVPYTEGPGVSLHRIGEISADPMSGEPFSPARALFEVLPGAAP